MSSSSMFLLRRQKNLQHLYKLRKYKMFNFADKERTLLYPYAPKIK